MARLHKGNLHRFYSKLVRLKVASTSTSISLSNKFLFQIGAIKSESAEDDETGETCFYSKLVRLKVFLILVMSMVLYQFLFQIGAIKSGAITAVKLASNSVTSFYSKLVRLKGARICTRTHNR